MVGRSSTCAMRLVVTLGGLTVEVVVDTGGVGTASGGCVGVSGWVMFIRHRRAPVGLRSP